MSNKQIKTDTIYLTLLDGNNIIFTYNSDYTEDITRDLREAIESGSMWYATNYEDSKAIYKGNELEFINTKLIVGY